MNRKNQDNLGGCQMPVLSQDINDTSRIRNCVFLVGSGKIRNANRVTVVCVPQQEQLHKG
jgi:hypothetical protein